MTLMKPLKKVLREPAYLPYYWKKLTREFRLFDLDYRFFNGYSFPPKSVCLILTEHCNLQCVMCDIGQKNAQGKTPEYFPLAESINKGETALVLEDWKRLVDDIVSRQWNPLLLLTETEPFIYPHISELIEYIVAHNLRVHITTNVTLLHRYAEELVDLCTKPESLTITLSLDGIDEVHDAIRGVKGTFNKALKGLRGIDERKKEAGRKWPEVGICYTISNYNCHHISEFVQWFSDKDFDGFGKIKNEKLLRFSNLKFDFLFHLDTLPNTYIENLLALSHARCRVSRADYTRKEFYDFMIHIRGQIGIEKLCNEILHYTKALVNNA